MTIARTLVLAAMALVVCSVAFAGEAAAPGTGQQYVTKEEYDALKNDLEFVKRRLSEIEMQRAANPPAGDQGQYSELGDQLTKLSVIARQIQPGTNRLIIAGDAGVSFTNQKGSNNTFITGLSPLFLWRVNDRLLFEGGLDFSLTNDPDGDNPGTDTSLSLANLSYIVNDYVIVGGGLFAVPFGIYHTHLDPRWINKFPDDPLALGDGGISPNTDTGVFVTGAAPVRGAVVNYAAYVTNGPTLITDDPGAAGSLSFKNNTDTNGNKAVGARVGFVPRPWFETGYSVQAASVSPNTFGREVGALLQAVDFNYVKGIDAIHGRVTARGEWVWSHVGRATYDPTGALGFGPVTFDNDRNGGYAMLAYRPSQVESAALSKTEFALRYDKLSAASTAPGGGTEERLTPCVLYWFTSTTVVKLAYEFDDRHGAAGQNALVVQLATGF
jgi:hypothetical protein